MSKMFVGEGLVIEGSDLDNVAHIDLVVGPKDGPVGTAFATALANQSQGHTNLLAIVSPNLPCKPATVMITKVTMKKGDQVTVSGADQPARIGRRSGGHRGPAQPPHLDVEPHPAAESDPKVRRPLVDAIGLVFDGEPTFFEQTQRDRELEGKIAPALVVAQPAGLLADLVPISLGERAEARRRDQLWTDLGGEQRIGAEEVGNQLVEWDRRT